VREVPKERNVVRAGKALNLTPRQGRERQSSLVELVGRALKPRSTLPKVIYSIPTMIDGVGELLFVYFVEATKHGFSLSSCSVILCFWRVKQRRYL
jgi:hypothetical protein